MTRPVHAVAVVVPARDEQDRIDACLAAIGRALPSLPALVCVVADRCRDATARRARAHGALVVVNEDALTIGEVRDLGVRAALRGLARPRELTWLLSTDADSVVPPTWVADQAAHAAAGADVVVGGVDLDDPASLPTAVLSRYRALTAVQDGVYAANLGVRADAYVAVGGFPAVRSGEDHALLRRLRARGRPVVVSGDARVRTSTRLRGRARSGLADLLCDLHLPDDPGLAATG